KGLRLGAPFMGLSTHLIRAGSFLFAGSVLSQASTIIGNMIASHEVLMIGGYIYEGDDPEIISLMEAGQQPFPDWPFPSEGWGNSLWPLLPWLQRSYYSA